MATVRLTSWNVNGVRAGIKKGFFDWLQEDQPDILGLQETKISADQLTPEMITPPGYHTYWSHCRTKKGYSGVAIFTKEKPISVREGFGIERFDAEGRIIIAEYPTFTIFNIYFPNGQMNEERLQYKLDFYDAFLEYADSLVAEGKHLIICGDYNTAHHPIDLARPKENEKISGFLPIERAWMDKYVEHGYIDTLREFNQEPAQYSWWNMRSRARERNVGWRIDYFFASQSLKDRLVSAGIQPEVMGSDHCPVTLELSV